MGTQFLAKSSELANMLFHVSSISKGVEEVSAEIDYLDCSFGFKDALQSSPDSVAPHELVNVNEMFIRYM